MIRNSLLSLSLLALAACTGPAEGPDVDYRVLATGESPLYISDVVLSPDGTRMAYSKQIEGLAAIYVAAADGSDPVRLTTGVWDVNPYWSPNGEWIAYYSDENADVWVVPSAGGTPKQLTSGPANDNPFGWLPDGSGVLFDRQGDGDARTLVAPLNGEAVRPLFQAPVGNVSAWPSPDGTKIGFILWTGGRSTLWVQEVAGGPARQLTTEGLEGGRSSRMWSPDSKQIVYASRRTGTSDLWIADVESGALRQLTDDIRDDYGAMWSPDGQWVLFESTRGGQEDQWVVPAAGGPARRVTADTDIENIRNWSGDGHSITYSAGKQSSAIVLRPAEGGAPRTLLTLDAYSIGNPLLSPDGGTVLFESNRSGSTDLWTVPVAGGEMTQVASSPSFDGAADWSPDGQWIVFLSGRRGTADLWVMPAGGGEPRQLTDWPSDEYAPRWSPDGKTIALLSNRVATQAEVWTIPAAGGTATRLTRGNVAAANVRWSRDGRSLLYVGATAAGSRQLFRIPATGGTARQLTRAEGGANIDPIFDLSPDGTRVAYGYQVAGWEFLEVVPSEGGTPRRFSTDSVRVYQNVPQWSPDGTQIAVSDWNFETNLANQMVVSVADGASRRLPATPDVHEFNARWTPDGRSLIHLRSTNATRFVTADLSRVLAAP